MNEIIYVGKHLTSSIVEEHSHDLWEIIYCTKGRGVMEFSSMGQTISYGEGEIIAIPPKTKHANLSEEGFENIYVHLKDAALPYKNPKKIIDGEEGYILHSFMEAGFYFNLDLAGKEVVLSALGSLISGYVTVYAGQEGISDVVEDIRRSIVKNFSDINYKLDEYMKSLPFSYDYLRKLFKKETGITPHEYLVRTRMNGAKMLLSGVSKHGYSINEISELCGFSEPLYFSRVFKKHFGCSPSAYAHKFVALSKKKGPLGKAVEVDIEDEE